MDERRKESENRSRLEKIHADYLKFSRRVAIALAIGAVVLIGGLAATAYEIRQNRNQTKTIRIIASRANDRAEAVRVLTTLTREKVCSESSNQPVACRALFNRLAGNISEEQRFKLACAVLDKLRGPIVRDIQRYTKCP